MPLKNPQWNIKPPSPENATHVSAGLQQDIKYRHGTRRKKKGAAATRVSFCSYFVQRKINLVAECVTGVYYAD